MPRPGRLKNGQTERPMTAPELEPRWLEDPLPPSCALDVADEHAFQLQELRKVGACINRDGDMAGKFTKRAIAKIKARGALDAFVEFLRIGRNGGGSDGGSSR